MASFLSTRAAKLLAPKEAAIGDQLPYAGHIDEATLKVRDSMPVSIGIPLGVGLSDDKKRFYVIDPRQETVEIGDSIRIGHGPMTEAKSVLK